MNQSAENFMSRAKQKYKAKKKKKKKKERCQKISWVSLVTSYETIYGFNPFPSESLLRSMK